MNYSTKRIIKEYRRALRCRLPYIFKKKKQFLTLTQKSMTEYASEHPSASTIDFQQEFGTVEQLCEEYKNFVSAKQMISSIQRTNRLNQFLGLIAVLLLLFLIYIFYHLCFSLNIHEEVIIQIETEAIDPSFNTQY